MMSKFTIVAVAFFLSSLSFGQSIVPEDANVILENTSRPCLHVLVDPSSDELKDAWVDYLSKNYQIKLKGTGFMSNKDVLTAEKIVLNSVSLKAMDLYTEIIQVEDKASMKLFAAFGYDIYLNSTDYPTEYSALKMVMSDFLNQYIAKYYNDKVAVHKKEVDGLTKDQIKLTKSIEKNNKKMEKMSSNMEKMTEGNQKSQKELDEVDAKLKVETEKLNLFREKLNSL